MDKDLADRVQKLEEGHRVLTSKVDENTRVTNSIKEDTGALVEFAKAAQGIAAVGRVVAAVGRFVGRVIVWVSKYVLPFVIAGAAVWAVVTGKKPPP